MTEGNMLHNGESGNLTGRLGTSVALAHLYRLGACLAESSNRKGNLMPAASTFLHDHVAVVNHGNGVGAENLANFTEAFANYSAGRILGTGRLQYELGGTGEQRFEGLSQEQLCDELLDELADSVNYISMLAVKVLAFRRSL